jgi:hypothetical protein
MGTLRILLQDKMLCFGVAEYGILVLVLPCRPSNQQLRQHPHSTQQLCEAGAAGA